MMRSRFFCRRFADFGREAQSRLANVALDHFHPFPQKLREVSAVAAIQRIEDRRFLDHLFKATQRGIGFLPPDEQINAPNLRQLHQGIDQPDFADETGHADQHDVLAGESPANREWTDVADSVEIDDRPIGHWNLPRGRNHRRLQNTHAGETEVVNQSFRGAAAVGS